MAGPNQHYTTEAIATKSYDTALCIIPPRSRCDEINKLRSLYDKAYEKWPPHVNLIYPFVNPEQLPRAKELIETHLQTNFSDTNQTTIRLGGAGIFKQKKDVTVFLQDKSDKEVNALWSLRTEVLSALGQKISPQIFHLTVGQAQDSSVSARQILMNKVDFLPAFEFDVNSLVILVRERKADATSQMRLWGAVDLGTRELSTAPMEEFWVTETAHMHEGIASGYELGTTSTIESMSNRQVQRGATYTFNSEVQTWTITTSNAGENTTQNLHVSSYNVLLDSEFPPSHDRDPLLIQTLLRESALADILVLQEVSDDFLIFLLQDENMRERYPFVSHGPPDQEDIGPLPSLRNIVVLSKWYFEWDFIPFHRRHKGAIVASFPNLHQGEDVNSGPLVVAGVHLSAGLTDGSVAAKKVQLHNVVTHLKQKYPDSPWILAGDFNIPTSRYTIDEAVKQKDITLETSSVLDLTETFLSENELVDGWAVSRVEGLDETTTLDTGDLFEGEEGATFNPGENPLAAYSSGTSENRPQRYDRILVRAQDQLKLIKFNYFGLPELIDNSISIASDHYGVRAGFDFLPATDHKVSSDTGSMPLRNIIHKHASLDLSLSGDLTAVLSKHGSFPTNDEKTSYKDALGLIKDVLLGGTENDSHVSDIPLVVVPVGSYALNVWTRESDIDCLCIGPISSKTFFQLARQRIHKAESRGVRLLRKVEANTGTMFELSVNGLNADLQYCPAADIVHRWSEFTTIPSTDPIFSLPILSLRKLKPIRDLIYIQRTLPSIASFRIAYHFIKRWSSDRGIYSAKFGYFGGVHITLMLSWVCKRLAHDTGSVSAEDLILSFFHYYAHFDWANDMVYDAFFHKKKPRYQRSAREPMVILGFHAPNSNIAHTATAPGLQVLLNELRQADERLSASGMTWEKFFDQEKPAMERFLTSSESYVKIDIQYWGRALSRGKGLVGWVESQCINLVVDIHKAIPHLSARIWPARFAEDEANASDTYYHGCYLISLSRDEEKGAMDKEEKAEAKATLEKVFDRFVTQVRADDRYYDESTAWVDVSLTKSSHVKELQPDNREWGIYMPDTDPDDDEEDEAYESDEDSEPFASKKLPIRGLSSEPSKAVSSNKLRPASDVLNRLRWDANLDPSNYIVGYEDRFLGAKELSLERWKTEQTDEEFIPQHRILYFKKKGDDGAEIVWERATRVDKIFGSGVGDGS